VNGADLRLAAASKGSWIELFLPAAGKTPRRTNSTPKLVKPLFLKLMNQTLPHSLENAQVQVVEAGAPGNRRPYLDHLHGRVNVVNQTIPVTSQSHEPPPVTIAPLIYRGAAQ
jgi:hypothetical protein